MDHEPHNSRENRSNSSFTRTEISTNHLACSVPSFLSIISTSISVFGVCVQNVLFDQSQNESSDTSHSNCWKRQKWNHVFSASALFHYKTSLTTCNPSTYWSEENRPPSLFDSAPSNRSTEKPQPTARHCRLTGLNHALTYSYLASISWRSEKLRRSPCTRHQVQILKSEV